MFRQLASGSYKLPNVNKTSPDYGHDEEHRQSDTSYIDSCKKQTGPYLRTYKFLLCFQRGKPIITFH